MLSMKDPRGFLVLEQIFTTKAGFIQNSTAELVWTFFVRASSACNSEIGLWGNRRNSDEEICFSGSWTQLPDSDIKVQEDMDGAFKVCVLMLLLEKIRLLIVEEGTGMT